LKDARQDGKGRRADEAHLDHPDQPLGRAARHAHGVGHPPPEYRGARGSRASPAGVSWMTLRLRSNNRAPMAFSG
jgi:hypothetical protein